jgi:hypothetical protein
MPVSLIKNSVYEVGSENWFYGHLMCKVQGKGLRCKDRDSWAQIGSVLGVTQEEIGRRLGIS